MSNDDRGRQGGVPLAGRERRERDQPLESESPGPQAGLVERLGRFPADRQAAVRYGGAVALTVIALLVIVLLEPLFAGRAPPLVLLALAIAAAAWWGGLGPGLAATGISAILVWRAVIAPGFPDLPETLRLSLTVLAGTVISLLAGSTHSAAARQRVFIARLADELRERRKVEAALLESEERFQAFMNNSPTIAWAKDEQGLHVYANKAFQQHVGLTLEQLRGKSDFDIFPEQIARTFRENDLAAIAAGRTIEVTEETTHAEGRRLWWNFKFPFRDASGRLYVGGMGVNITDRKQSEEALRKSEERFRALMTASSEVVYSMSPDWSEMLQLHSGGFLLDSKAPSRTWLHDYIPADDQALVLATINEAICLKSAFQLEHRVFRLDGSIGWTSSRAVPILDANGEVVEWFGAASDITEAKRAKAELEAERERWKSVVEGIAEEVWLCDAEGKMSLINLPPATALGLAPFSGRTVQEVISELDLFTTDERPRPAEDAPLLRSLRGEIVRGQEIARERKTGRTRYREYSSAPTRDADGNITGAVAIVRDITELHEAKQQLEKANAVKDEFLATLSHELRTPLSPIFSAVQLLQRNAHELSEKAQQYIEIVSRNVELEARLIDDLLDLTRIARGKISLEKRLVEIDIVLQRAAEICMPDIKAKRLEFGIDLKAASYVVYGDIARLQQVIWNLLKNSIKFTPEGGCVGIRGFLEDDNVVIEVNDSGIGIEPGTLPLIFNAFEQGGARITRQFGGLGLGLAITKRLVELHGGTISACSSGKNRGATFRITLPSAKELAQRLEKETSRPRQERAAHQQRILLVEDHTDTAALMKELLQHSGYDVETAADVAQSLEAMDKGNFDLLISDLGLPDGSGIDLMKELRHRKHLIKGIALSGFGRDEDIERSKQAGFSEHLIKPIDFDVLLNTIGRVI